MNLYDKLDLVQSFGIIKPFGHMAAYYFSLIHKFPIQLRSFTVKWLIKWNKFTVKWLSVFSTVNCIAVCFDAAELLYSIQIGIFLVLI